KVVPLVKDTARLIFKGSASVAQVTVQKDIRDIKADVGQIGQVLQSVLLNALEASPEGAPVEIKISNMDLPAEKDPVLTEGRYVRVLVRNTGPGIPNENIQKIFDPFYTTKPGRSGLGLSAAYSIVRKHQGSITVESKGQKGTSVSVYIPVWMEDSGKSIGSSAQPSSPIRRILLMDDDEHVQGFLKEVLTHMGYQVEACYDGEEAIRLYREKGEARNPYDCVILDLTVPNGMGGREAAEGILSFDSNARMIASSVYSTNPVMGNYKKFGFIGVLPKPYRARDLERVLDRVLSARNNE
ncbi:MAG TPA: ATP-binding protein, partial [Nitrospiria bacterium]